MRRKALRWRLLVEHNLMVVMVLLPVSFCWLHRLLVLKELMVLLPVGMMLVRILRLFAAIGSLMVVICRILAGGESVAASIPVVTQHKTGPDRVGATPTIVWWADAVDRSMGE